MNTQPLVSVIIIFLNAERFIAEAIESVFAQSYEGWELLLVDDGSTDGSAVLAQDYAAQHPGRVRYLTHPDRQNRGMSASRNLGIRHARGEYLAMLDADDVWLPHKLAEQVAIFAAQPAAMVYGNALFWHSWTGDPADAEWDDLPVLGAGLDTLIEPPKLLNLLLPPTNSLLPGTARPADHQARANTLASFENSRRPSQASYAAPAHW